jgi:predicted nucleic acid-binding protein
VTTIYSPTITSDLKSHTLFLDTNVFIFASKNKSFFDFLVELKNKGDCAFATIQPVIFEYTRGIESAKAYNERIEFVNSVVDWVNPMKFLEDIEDFHVLMAKVNSGNKSYTDFLLAACLYQYGNRNTALLTADLKALPSFYERSHIITVEHGNELKNFGVYRMEMSGYFAALASALGVKLGL